MHIIYTMHNQNNLRNKKFSHLPTTSILIFLNSQYMQHGGGRKLVWLDEPSPECLLVLSNDMERPTGPLHRSTAVCICTQFIKTLFFSITCKTELMKQVAPKLHMPVTFPQWPSMEPVLLRPVWAAMTSNPVLGLFRFLNLSKMEENWKSPHAKQYNSAGSLLRKRIKCLDSIAWALKFLSLICPDWLQLRRKLHFWEVLNL